VLDPGKTYELTLEREATVEPLPKEVWVHKVAQRIPDLTDRASWKKWARRASIEGRIKDNDGQWSFKSGSRGITVFGEGMRLMAYGNTDSPAEELVRAAAKKAKMRQVKDKGEAEMRAMGWWPKGIDPETVECGPTLTSWGGESYVSHLTAEYRGRIEGRLVDGPGLFYRIKTVVTGSVYLAELRWAETERLAELECRSIQEAFDALNRGRAQPLPKQCVGSKAKFVGIVYWINETPAEGVHPFHKFQLTTPKGYHYDAYVPAIKDKYFKNPKRQVVIKEIEEAKKTRE